MHGPHLALGPAPPPEPLKVRKPPAPRPLPRHCVQKTLHRFAYSIHDLRISSTTSDSQTCLPLAFWTSRWLSASRSMNSCLFLPLLKKTRSQMTEEAVTTLNQNTTKTMIQTLNQTMSRTGRMQSIGREHKKHLVSTSSSPTSKFVPRVATYFMGRTFSLSCTATTKFSQLWMETRNKRILLSCTMSKPRLRFVVASDSQ